MTGRAFMAFEDKSLLKLATHCVNCVCPLQTFRYISISLRENQSNVKGQQTNKAQARCSVLRFLVSIVQQSSYFAFLLEHYYLCYPFFYFI